MSAEVNARNIAGLTQAMGTLQKGLRTETISRQKAERGVQSLTIQLQALQQQVAILVAKAGA